MTLPYGRVSPSNSININQVTEHNKSTISLMNSPCISTYDIYQSYAKPSKSLKVEPVISKSMEKGFSTLNQQMRRFDNLQVP